MPIPDEISRIQELAASGFGPSAIARELGIPRHRARYWSRIALRSTLVERLSLTSIGYRPRSTRTSLGCITREHPGALLRGLIHSDGSRFIATQVVHHRTYRYARYDFANRSEGIKAIFCEHLDLLGIRWTRLNDRGIQIARRTAVAALDAFIGPKR